MPTTKQTCREDLLNLFDQLDDLDQHLLLNLARAVRARVDHADVLASEYLAECRRERERTGRTDWLDDLLV
jgi:hypothetical protein